MSDKKRILIMFGGPSPEHEVSRNSASCVAQNIDREKYDVDIIGITKDGRWFLTKAEPHEMADGSWSERADNVPAVISPDRSVHGYVTGAPGEKDGSGALRPGQAGFLPEVKRRSARPQAAVHAAEAGLSGEPVCAAAPGAELTLRIHFF
jgi:D-alanine-D-alanine ligase-like ATP-grasp enzyme